MSDALRDLYREVILDHSRNPRNRRHPAEANRQAQGENPLCGDQVTVFLTVDEHGRIADAGFEGRGCAICMASSSLMTEAVGGKSRQEALALSQAVHVLAAGGEVPAGLAADGGGLLALSGVRDYPMRRKCATLAWDALRAALE